MSELVRIITAEDAEVRNRSLDAFCRTADTAQLMAECAALDEFWRQSDNLYERVRAQFFLYAIYRFHLPFHPGAGSRALVPFQARTHFLRRRFEEAIDLLLEEQQQAGPGPSLSSALSAAYRSLGFQTLSAQVRRSVRSVRGNQWMSRAGHPLEHPLCLRPELRQRLTPDEPFPILVERTPVRLDLTHSGWSDIFFLGMDAPESARVVNISIDLSVRGQGGGDAARPPVECYLRVIDEPVLRLTSVDLNATTDVRTFAEVFDFARDYLGLLKAAVIASGIVPPAMEGADQPLANLLRRLTGQPQGGIELVSQVRNIPKGSRLAVSTNLLACLITACMRATGQIANLTGPLEEPDRRLVAARAILGEWLGGSGGGWQDSGGVWPGIKRIEGVAAGSGDPEYGVSRGRLLPQHSVLPEDEVSAATRQKLQDSLVLVHGGMAQDVGPILEMVTEKYLLRSEREWEGRREALHFYDAILDSLRGGGVDRIGSITEKNFFGPIQTIIPWATNLYTETLIQKVRGEMGAAFWGFWMMGGMSGGGMGFIFQPEYKAAALDRLQTMMSETKRHLERSVPFAMEPVVYNFAINEHGTRANLLSGDGALMPSGYYTLMVPSLLRLDPLQLSTSRRAELDRFAMACRVTPELAGMVQQLFDRLLPRTAPQDRRQGSESLSGLLQQFGFDRVQHEQIQADLRLGRIGLAQNRLPPNSIVEDARPEDVYDATAPVAEEYRQRGLEALAAGMVAVVSLAGGAGSRWTSGAGVVKALNPFCKLGGKHRNFLETHFAKSRRTSRRYGAPVPHVVTTSYLTHGAIEEWTRQYANAGDFGPILLSPGQTIGLRMIPTVRDLRFAWEEMPQQLLDEQKQKVRESLHEALIGWTQHMGEASDYTDNVPMQCLHPVGHWYEVPNLLRNGVLQWLLEQFPRLTTLLVHNVDTLGADLDPGLLGYHLHQRAWMTAEVIFRQFDDRGGGLARVDGRTRLIEGLALPSEEIESTLSYYNSGTSWVDIDQLLSVFHLSRQDLGNEEKVAEAIRHVAAAMPTYVTLKDVKKRWGLGQEDVFPVTQWEKLWGDMTLLPHVPCRFVQVSRMRGQQLKEPAQLDGWLRDGSAAYVEQLCDWA